MPLGKCEVVHTAARNLRATLMAGNELTPPHVIAEPTMPMTVLICGSPASGFQIIGLFANSADAQSYAEDYSLKDWWVAELGICGKSSGDGFEVPSLTDFRNRLSKLVPLCGAQVEFHMGPMASAYQSSRRGRTARL